MRSMGYFKKIDFVFANEKKIRELVMEAKQGSGEHGANGGGVSDPTAAQAIHNVMPIRFITVNGSRLEWPEAWLRVIDMVRMRCSAEQIVVLQGMTMKESYHKTLRKLNVSQSTLSRMRHEVRHFQELCAVQEGLIRIF